MFDRLGTSLEEAFDKLKGFGKITEDNIDEVLRDVRIALLEADVNYKVVKNFTTKVKEKALGEALKSVKPKDLFVKIVNDELISLLGKESAHLEFKKKPGVILLCGLQGSGKTTMAGKLANYLRKKEGKRPLLVACDIHRPAAKEQLEELAKQLGVAFYKEDSMDAASTALNSIEYARNNNLDLVIVDTAGRLQIDEELMNELKDIERAVKADEVLLVLDAMIGQDAINVIEGFNKEMPLTGAVLTKMDGDTRGGVALSVREITNVPIKFIGTSEKLSGIDLFDPKRMADRILGMGDVVSLVEKAEELIDEKEAEKAYKKMQAGKFDLDDFLKQMQQIKKLGPLEGLIKMLPGARKAGLDKLKVDPKETARLEAIISSMTLEERRNPNIIKASRKQRIAKGSGTSVQDVNKLLNNFENAKKMFKMFKDGNFKMPF